MQATPHIVPAPPGCQLVTRWNDGAITREIVLAFNLTGYENVTPDAITISGNTLHESPIDGTQAVCAPNGVVSDGMGCVWPSLLAWLNDKYEELQ